MPLPPAAGLSAEGRWDDLAELVDERLSCGDATYACLLRDHFRAEKDWARADGLRDRLEAAGFEVRDTPAGTQVVRRTGRDDAHVAAIRGARVPDRRARAAGGPAA